jgi:hypothetical protein
VLILLGSDPSAFLCDRTFHQQQNGKTADERDGLVERGATRTGVSHRSCSLPGRAGLFSLNTPHLWTCRNSESDIVLLATAKGPARQAHGYSAGNTASTPFFFTKTTTNTAGFVVLALRPTMCTSSRPS